MSIENPNELTTMVVSREFTQNEADFIVQMMYEKIKEEKIISLDKLIEFLTTKGIPKQMAIEIMDIMDEVFSE